jgi:hypothetical protein
MANGVGFLQGTEGEEAHRQMVHRVMDWAGEINTDTHWSDELLHADLPPNMIEFFLRSDFLTVTLAVAARREPSERDIRAMVQKAQLPIAWRGLLKFGLLSPAAAFPIEHLNEIGLYAFNHLNHHDQVWFIR